MATELTGQGAVFQAAILAQAAMFKGALTLRLVKQDHLVADRAMVERGIEHAGSRFLSSMKLHYRCTGSGCGMSSALCIQSWLAGAAGKDAVE